jgi:hypothetical protein
MRSNMERLVVYRQQRGGLSFWQGPGSEPVDLELSPGWRQGLSQFGKTMLLGPGQGDALDIEAAITRGVARVLNE